MLGLYPSIQPYQVHRLPVDRRHTLYIEESGNPGGIPVLYLHGGPGIGTSDTARRFFNPERYRIILLDQRGAGQSTPHATLEDNTTPHLIADLERIRTRLGIERWLVFGGSWGSTLALCYAIEHPARVLGLVLRGVFLARERDLEWLYGPQGGAAQLFPDYYQDFLAPLGLPGAEQPASGRAVIDRYYPLLTSGNELQRLMAARAWAIWEGRQLSIKSNPHADAIYGDAKLALPMARIECHYFKHRCFIDEGHILRHKDRLHHLPAVVIHGRFDTVCALQSAWQLCQDWSLAKLNIVPEAGHAALEPGVLSALRQATDAFAVLLEKKP